jgi:hypothetical protein
LNSISFKFSWSKIQFLPIYWYQEWIISLLYSTVNSTQSPKAATVLKRPKTAIHRRKCKIYNIIR